MEWVVYDVNVPMSPILSTFPSHNGNTPS